MVHVNILRNQEVPFLITSHTLLYTKIYINTMKPLQLNCRRTNKNRTNFWFFGRF